MLFNLLFLLRFFLSLFFDVILNGIFIQIFTTAQYSFLPQFQLSAWTRKLILNRLLAGFSFLFRYGIWDHPVLFDHCTVKPCILKRLYKFTLSPFTYINRVYARFKRFHSAFLCSHKRRRLF